MAAAKPSPRRSEERGADGGEPQRRGTSHGVALALAIGLTLLLLIGRWAFIFWMNDGEQRSVVAPEPAAAAAVEERSQRLPAEVAAERQEAPVAAHAEAANGDAPFAPPLPPWRIECEVVDAAGPVAGATVDLVLDRGGRSTPLATVTTGANGSAEHAIAATIVASVPAVARESVAILGVARASHHHLDTCGAAFDPASDLCSLRFDLEVGASARGRVVNASGAPVEWVMVRAFVFPNEPAIEESWSDALGRFELPIRVSERWRVTASAGYGVGVIASIDVTPFVDIELGDLVVTGRGFVGGRTVDRHGHPLGRVNVSAQAVGDTPDEFLAEQPATEERDGHISSSTWSLADGTFRIDGLATGRYRLDTPFEQSSETGGMALHGLGDTSAELVIERHRLRVFVVDEAGATVLEAECRFMIGELGWLVSRVGSQEPEEDGSIAVDARAGERVVVSASLAGCTQVEGEHTFGSDDEEAELRLVLRPRGERTGAIELAIVDEAGKSVSPATVTLWTPLGAVVDDWYRKPLAATSRIEGLEFGRYRVEAFAGAPAVAGVPESTLHFPATCEVEVRTGETTKASVTARAGGRLRFILRASPGGAINHLAEGFMELVNAAGGDPSLDDVYRMQDNGTVEFGALRFEPDVPYVGVSLLEPGAHCLRFTAHGFQPLEQSFTIRAGQITDVDLLLEPE